MTENTQAESKINKARGAANPYVGLEHSLVYADQLRKAVGKGPFSREVAARGLEHISLSGPAIGKIAALIHFSLLARDGNTYSITPLADRILLPVSNEDKTNAIIEAVSKPKLYKQLIDKYRGQALPLMLDNILVREYGINEKRAKEVAKTFKKSLEFAGILNNGIITESAKTGSSREAIVKTTSANAQVGVENTVAVPQEFYSVELPSGIKVEFPKSMSYNVVVGDFSDEIKGLNEKAARILKEVGIKDEKS